MIRKWPGQTKEEWMKEYERDKALTPEERQRELDEYVANLNKKHEASGAEKELRQQKNAQEFFKGCDHPNSLENSEATILWVIVMLVGSIFKGNWMIWIVATFIWWRYITRHKR